jgi:hypothetical protein
MLKRLMEWLGSLVNRRRPQATPDPFAVLLTEFSAESERLVEAETQSSVIGSV